MIKKMVKKKSAEMISKTAEMIARRDASQACMYFFYQPKQPEVLRKKQFK